jgi:hypothetical protein
MNTGFYPLPTVMLVLIAFLFSQTSQADEFHAARVGGTWTITNVAPTPPYSTYTFNSLAIQPNNHPAFVYHEYGAAIWDESFQAWMPSGAPGKLRYAEFDGTSWTTTVVDDDGNTGFSGSLAFDSIGTPHISYVSYSADTLRYAKRVNGTWQKSTLEHIGPYTGTDGTPQSQDVSATTLVIHPVTGNPTVSYLHQSNYTYRYGILDSGVFTSEPVEYIASMSLKTLYPSEGRFLTHDLDSQGNPHLAYWTMNTADGTSGLEYATKDSQGNWSQSTINESGMTWYSDLKVGSDDVPRVAYHEQLPYSQSNGFMGVLKFAEQTEAGWQSNLVDGGTPRQVSGADYVGWHPSLALDAGNTPHISYADVGGQAIKYATRSNGAWSTEIIDEGTYMIGLMSSLAIDSNGTMHVAYDPPVAPVPEPSTLALAAGAAALLAWRRVRRRIS